MSDDPSKAPTIASKAGSGNTYWHLEFRALCPGNTLPQMQLDEDGAAAGGNRLAEQPEEGRGTDEQGEYTGGCHDDADGEVTEMAMVALSLLRRDDKTMLQQVKHLVKANLHLAQKVFTTEVDGWTPVHACALRGKKKVLKAMLQAGVDVNLRMGQPEGLPGQCSLLHIAANRSEKKVAEYLLHHGADVNARDSFGRTPMFYAQRAGNRECVRTLAESGGHLADRADEGETLSATGSDELTTPEPKTTRFCFLPVPHHNFHHHPHHNAHRHQRRLQHTSRHSQQEQQQQQQQQHHQQEGQQQKNHHQHLQ